MNRISFQSFSRQRRGILSRISVLGFVLAIVSPFGLSGCGDDKGGMTQVENPEDPAVKAKDSMDAYKKANFKGNKPVPKADGSGR
jgi:hypothetical protein